MISYRNYYLTSSPLIIPLPSMLLTPSLLLHHLPHPLVILVPLNFLPLLTPPPPLPPPSLHNYTPPPTILTSSLPSPPLPPTISSLPPPPSCLPWSYIMQLLQCLCGSCTPMLGRPLPWCSLSPCPARPLSWSSPGTDWLWPAMMERQRLTLCMSSTQQKEVSSLYNKCEFSHLVCGLVCGTMVYGDMKYNILLTLLIV